MASKTNGYRANGTNGYARGDSVRRGTGEPRVSDRDRRSTRESALSDTERRTTEEPPSRRYTEEDAQLVDEAKRTHKATTASAQRAAKVQLLALSQLYFPSQIITLLVSPLKSPYLLFNIS